MAPGEHGARLASSWWVLLLFLFPSPLLFFPLRKPAFFFYKHYLTSYNSKTRKIRAFLLITFFSFLFFFFWQIFLTYSIWKSYVCVEKRLRNNSSGIRLPWVSIISLFSSGPIGFLFEWKHPSGFFSCLLNADGDKKKEKKEGRSHCVPRGQSSPNLTQQLSITNPSLVFSWLFTISQPSEQAADCFWASWLAVYRRVAPC